ncbi:DUF2742 domain-containing protein [Gordonia sp. NPDC003585]|uniref:DUF2742 domain-containing protein n=1 Tax=Gordonia sp. NPDC003585 TaxID=3154275 RepID=UPI0033A056EB
MAEKEHRPGVGPGRCSELSDGGSLVAQYTTGTDIVAVTRFAAELQLGLDYIPTVGSAQWCALADDDPAKLASMVRAGAAWAIETAMLPALLAQQLAAEDALACQRLREMSHDLSAGHDWAAEARRIRDRRQFAEQHPWAKRVAS